MDPELLKILIQDAEIEGNQEELNRLLTLADELRTQGNTPVEGDMRGRVYVPPSWSQGLNQMVAAGRGGIKEGRADKLRGEQSKARGEMRQSMLAALLRGGAAPQSAGAPGNLMAGGLSGAVPSSRSRGSTFKASETDGPMVTNFYGEGNRY